MRKSSTGISPRKALVRPFFLEDAKKLCTELGMEFYTRSKNIFVVFFPKKIGKNRKLKFFYLRGSIAKQM